ncbi:hypothetical protein ENHAE0001_0518 [Enhydrobacter aerosaccus SK60]|nr:hypothetical protein ENHAE0001_0518 [Enhydrobacter aerosaccus SK60]
MRLGCICIRCVDNAFVPVFCPIVIQQRPRKTPYFTLEYASKK